MKSSKTIISEYLDQADWRVKENSTVNYSIGGLILSNSAVVTSDYWLNQVYDKTIADAHTNGDIHIHDLSILGGYCFTGDTRVKTLDGRNPTFEELIRKGVKEVWVYAYDKDSNEIVPAKAINPRITRQAQDMVRVKLCTGDTLVCTEDHPFMMRDGSFKRASELKVGESVMPLHITEKNNYTQINPAWATDAPGKTKKCYAHRWIASWILGRPLDEDEIVHHINGNKHDNRPENLEVMKSKDHRRMELQKTMGTTLWKTSNHTRLTNYNKSVEKRQSVSDFAKTRERAANGTFAFKYNSAKDPLGAAYNHQIRKVEKIHYECPVDVYDLTVPGYENFAVQGNIFVHNCAGWSLRQLIEEGLGGVPGKITSSPASHLSTLCNQMVNFLGIMQNEWAGKNTM